MVSIASYLKTKQGRLTALAVGAVGLFMVAGKKRCQSGRDDIILDQRFDSTAAVQPGEEVSTGVYRVLAARREGFTYMPVQGTVGDKLTFNGPDRKAEFTWNVVQEGGQVSAEFK